MPPTLRRLGLLATSAALALAGCGNTRTPVPAVGAPAVPGPLHSLYLPAAGIILQVPRYWLVTTARAPLLATVSSGSATVAVWRYPRTAPPPLGSAARRAAEQALLSAARARDPHLEPIRTAAITLAGRPAIELDAFEHVGGHLRRVRSVHVYAPGGEVVLDASAPPAVFHPVDHAVFSPVKRSLRLVG